MSVVLSYLSDDGPSSYYTDTFRNVVEEHLEVIKVNESTSKKEITPYLSYKYENNLFGLLLELEYPKYMHWSIMRANNYHSPTDFKKNTTFIYIPSISFLEQLLKIHNSKEDYI